MCNFGNREAAESAAGVSGTVHMAGKKVRVTTCNGLSMGGEVASVVAY
jgi:hypothetical protein